MVGTSPGELSPGELSPGEPTPGEPTPGVPTPGVPTPGVLTPGVPTPGEPTPGEPTPGVPTPGVPTPGVSPPDAPALLYDPDVTHRPSRADIAQVQLSSELQAIGEHLASHVHDLWMARRHTEGWRYGPRRDDDRKEHPCMVPYEQLPEHEKAVDREVACGVLKALVASGYRIVPAS